MTKNVTSAGNKFPKGKRLLKRSDFQKVYYNGRRQFTGNMTVFYRRRDQTEAAAGPRIGLTVGRVLGGAVERNRIKRRMREAVRLCWPECQAPVDIVLHPRKGVLTLPFAKLMEEAARALRLAVPRAPAAGQK